MRATDHRLVLYALLLIVIMLVRPQGLFGTRELPDVLRGFAKRRRAGEAAGRSPAVKERR